MWYISRKDWHVQGHISPNDTFKTCLGLLTSNPIVPPTSSLLSSCRWPQMTNLWFISAHHTPLSFGLLLSTNFERLDPGQDPVLQHHVPLMSHRHTGSQSGGSGEREGRVCPGLVHRRREDGHLHVLYKHLQRSRAWFQSVTLVLVNSCGIPKALPPLSFLLPHMEVSWESFLKRTAILNLHLSCPRCQHSSQSSHTMYIMERSSVLEGKSDCKKRCT